MAEIVVKTNKYGITLELKVPGKKREYYRGLKAELLQYGMIMSRKHKLVGDDLVPGVGYVAIYEVPDNAIEEIFKIAKEQYKKETGREW